MTSFSELATHLRFQTQCEFFRLVLARLKQQLDVDGIVAGGAPRDAWHDKPFKDIDVFIHLPDEPAFSDLMTKVTEAGYSITDWFPGSYVNYDPDLVGVAGFDMTIDDQTVLVQIVALRYPVTPENVIGRIDFGLCRIGVSSEGIHVTPEFLNDVNARTMTIHSGHSLARSKDRFQRLTAEKYAGYTLVNPFAEEDDGCIQLEPSA